MSARHRWRISFQAARQVLGKSPPDECGEPRRRHRDSDRITRPKERGVHSPTSVRPVPRRGRSLQRVSLQKLRFRLSSPLPQIQRMRFQGFEDAKIALIEGIVTGLIEKRPA
ncbi:hypothetical protein NAG74_34390 [Sinorhizobium meliloti]|nr:hypothetical protein [Sinorhizobium meliloti]MCO5966723.1 hypothetical protein [Sinorhizobium meliloti]